MPRSAERSALAVMLVTDGRDWHARQLEAACQRAGARCVNVDLAACGFDTSSPSGLDLPHFGGGLPDVVLVRSMAAGSFEAITKRLGVLHALGALGVEVWNDARAIERCVDKSATSFWLGKQGLPTPMTWTVESRETAGEIVAREIGDGPLVLKPLFGAQGRGLKLIRAPADLPEPDEIAGVYYLQRFQAVAGDDFRDYRLFVLRGRVVAAMIRRAVTWITNIKQGGEPVAVEPETTMAELAVAAAAAVGASFAGVDILVGRDGASTILEVNSMPAWSGLQKVSAQNIAETIVAALVDRAPRRRGT